jgi:hypothetical protein
VKYAGCGGRAEVRVSYGAHDIELVIEDVRCLGMAAPALPG